MLLFFLLAHNPLSFSNTYTVSKKWNLDFRNNFDKVQQIFEIYGIIHLDI